MDAHPARRVPLRGPGGRLRQEPRAPPPRPAPRGRLGGCGRVRLDPWRRGARFQEPREILRPDAGFPLRPGSASCSWTCWVNVGLRKRGRAFRNVADFV